MQQALRPGLTENQLWSILHQTNIAHGGDFIECRLLTSGPRTIPWFKECGTRTLRAGDLVTFDTDMIGPSGYLADISRAYTCPGRKATPAQRDLYALAQEQVLHNVALLRPGVTFREFAEKSWKVPPRYFKNRYMVLAHGVGLTDEYPAVLYDGDQQADGYDGIFEENMMVSVESYLGEEGGREGIKLEQQVLITASGAEPFSRTRFEDALEIE
jgi:Xaa-Pro aminopeptidase